MTVSNRVQDNIAGATVLTVFVLAAGVSLTYGSRARLVPLAVAVTAIVVMLVQLVLQNVRRAEAKDEPTTERGGTVLGSLAVTGSFVVGILLVGILPATLVFVFAYLRWVGKVRVLVAMAYAAGAWGALYLVFVAFLGVFMYPGVFELWVPYLSG